MDRFDNEENGWTFHRPCLYIIEFKAVLTLMRRSTYWNHLSRASLQRLFGEKPTNFDPGGEHGIDIVL